MNAGKHVICFGEVLLRLAPTENELLLQTGELRATFAGAEANVAVALAAFGNPTRMLTILPESAIGKAALTELRKHGVDTSHIQMGPGRMGLFFLTPGAVRRPSEVLYDRAYSAFALAPENCCVVENLANANWFHLSGITPALGRNCAKVAIESVRAAQAQNITVSFDGNYRSKLWETWQSEAPGILRSIVEHSNILFGDERDISLVLERSFDEGTSAERRQRAVDAAFKAFPRLNLIACTSRAQHSVDRQDYGAFMFSREAVYQVKPIELSGIVDRIGTGDAFAAGVIHGLLNNMSKEQALNFGHAAACLKHSIPGDFFTLSAQEIQRAIEIQTLDVKR